MDEQRQDDQLEPVYNISVPIQDVALKTSRERQTGGERGSGRSVLAVRHDDDDDDDVYYRSIDNYIYIYIYYMENRLIGLVDRVFASVPGDLGSIPGHVIPKTLKWYLVLPFLTLSNIRYVSR